MPSTSLLPFLSGSYAEFRPGADLVPNLCGVLVPTCAVGLGKVVVTHDSHKYTPGKVEKTVKDEGGPEPGEAASSRCRKDAANLPGLRGLPASGRGRRRA